MSAGTGERPDYGLDAPSALWITAGYGLVALAAGIALKVAEVDGWWVDVPIASGIASLGYAAFHLWTSKRGKQREAKALLDAIPWRGDERVLDVGCGHGLLLINAAQRLTTGRAIGIDVWSQKDQWHNSSEATVDNARRAGVADRVEVRDGDARHLEFPDESFDVVVSSLVIHNIAGDDGRAQAIKEIARVLKPGGHVAIVDIAATGLYQRVLEAAPGMIDVRRSGAGPLFVPASKRVTATKA
jgi:SAM-dependent methyltransferase